ncbi:recombinase family protein [Salinicoccus sesuvii]|uniref:Recombinase family protein n=1 Tax=Salinicoccus sesuvii TaxID=868281 RepID=A0ABV7N0P4_9STAP
MTKIGYARVSTIGQNEERQIKPLKGYSCEKIFIDKQSGKDFNRTEYKNMKNYVREKDTIVFVELDRLGRNKNEINKEWEYFINKDVDIVVLDMPLLDTTKYQDDLGKLLLNLAKEIISYNAEQERIRILERQTQGIEIAKREGKYKSRSKSYSATSKNKEKRRLYFLVIEYLNKKKPIKQIAEELSMSRDTVYRIKNEIENK